jgi:hypothetical protein
MFNSILHGELGTGITAWSLPVAINRSEVKDGIERLVAFGGEQNCGTKALDVCWEMDKKVKLGLEN